MKRYVCIATILATMSHAVLAVERTTATRSGKIYEKAEITAKDRLNVTISYAQGTALISLQDLPGEIQKEVGFIPDQPGRSPADAEKARLENRKKRWIQKFLEEEKEKKARLAGITNPTQPDANAFFGTSREELQTRLGLPLDSASSGEGNDDFELLLYENTPGKRTLFVSFNREKTVIAGLYKGLRVLDRTKEPSNPAEIVKNSKGSAKRAQAMKNIEIAIEMARQLDGITPKAGRTENMNPPEPTQQTRSILTRTLVVTLLACLAIGVIGIAWIRHLQG
jgi:hypothetical protein